MSKFIWFSPSRILQGSNISSSLFRTCNLNRCFSNSTLCRRDVKKLVDFSDFKSAFKGKSSNEIIRSLFILQLCSFDLFVNNSLKLMTISEKILGPRLFGAIIRPTFYNQFVAGDNNESMSFVISRLIENKIRPMIACMMEDDETATSEIKEKECDNNFKRIIGCIKLLGHKGGIFPSLQVKITGLIPVDLMVKLNNICHDLDHQIGLIELFTDCIANDVLQNSPLLEMLDDEEKNSLRKGLQRLNAIASEAVKNGVIILIDAEYISMNSAFNIVALTLMKQHNKHQPFILDTVQCYLKEAYRVVFRQLEVAKILNVCYGLKVVRGAYMEKERHLASKQNYPDPINSTYEETNNMYNKVCHFLLEHANKAEQDFRIIIATHNEGSIHKALARLSELKISPQSETVNFAQLYGMSDQVTFPLSQAGYFVYKSIPYGTISEVLPYLYRRATENRSVLKGSRRERELLLKEMKRRIFSKT